MEPEAGRGGAPGGPPDDGAGEPLPVVLEIEAALDLHPFAPRDVPRAVEAYLEAAALRGFAEVRLIHGKGKGVQRARVQQLLAASAHVLEFRDAPPERGGWGATIVRLRPPADPAAR